MAEDLTRNQEIKEEPIQEYDLTEWKAEMLRKINEILTGQEKVVVSLAGASASGKGEASDQLKRELENEGKRILVISTDDFYRGIARMLVEKLTGYIDISSINIGEFMDKIQVIISDKDFPDKFDSDTLDRVKDYLTEIDFQGDIDSVANGLVTEFNSIDFDNPDAVDLEALDTAIGALKNDQEVALPIYSMKKCEPSGEKTVSGKNYDVILVEGIYGLNSEATGKTDIKSFIESDLRTLLMRRMRRDVIGGRAPFPPELSLWITLEIVLPAYQKYTLPDRSKADMVLKNDFTLKETFDTASYDVQDKIPLTAEESAALIGKFGKPSTEVTQEDYYYTNDAEGHNPDHLIRARVENGKLKDLIHKGSKISRSDSKIFRPTETYIQPGQFGDKFKNPKNLEASFQKAGFRLAGILKKKRQVYRVGNIEVNYDEIEGLGSYLELRTNNKIGRTPEIDAFEKDYGLSDRSPVGPYVDEYLAKSALK